MRNDNLYNQIINIKLLYPIKSVYYDLSDEDELIKRNEGSIRNAKTDAVITDINSKSKERYIDNCSKNRYRVRVPKFKSALFESLEEAIIYRNRCMLEREGRKYPF